MNQRTLAIISVAAVVAIGAIAAAWYFLHPSAELKSASQAPIIGKAQVGQPAPEVVVATTAGLFDLNKTKKPVFLEVFATWCPHCQAETATIDRLYQKYKDRVEFVGVSGSELGIDHTMPETQADVIAWGQQFHAQYPLAFDPLLDVATKYLQGGFPTLAVIDKNKNVSYLDSGEQSYDTLAAAIEKVL